jgi:hypothetical protein
MPQNPPQPPKRTRKPSATRLLKGALAAGLQVRGIELDSTGTMRVLVGKPDEPNEQVKDLIK